MQAQHSSLNNLTVITIATVVDPIIRVIIRSDNKIGGQNRSVSLSTSFEIRIVKVKK